MAPIPDGFAARPFRDSTSRLGPLGRQPVPPTIRACLASLNESYAWEGTVARRMNSRIHRARSGTCIVAIKECFDCVTRDIDKNAAGRQFAALERIANAARLHDMPNMGPVPLALCADHGAYAMTWESGTAATSLFLSCNEPREAAHLGALAGAWLRAFHAMHPLSGRPSDFRSKLPLIIHRVRNSAMSGDPLIARCTDALAARVIEASGIELPASWIHGDMKADNLLVDGDRVIGLDFQLAHENTVVYDLAPFVNHLRLLRWSMRGITRASVMRAAINGFLDAYSTATPGWSLPIAWARAYLLLQVVARSATLPRRIANWPVRWELESVLDALTCLRGQQGS